MGEKTMEKKVDRRVRRTRKRLSRALLELIMEQDYESITIQDITDRADLNRATFYLHYGSKEELLIVSLEERFDELVGRFDQLSAERPIWEEKQSILLTFQHVGENANLYKVLLSERGMGYLIHRIVDYIAELSSKQLQDSLPQEATLNIPSGLISRHVAGSLFALLSWWVTNDMPYSAEYMTNIMHQLCVNGTLSAVELAHENFLTQRRSEAKTQRT
jgi:AcrR family transcriptional regulator